MAIKNAQILQKIGCSPVQRPDGSHDFVVPLKEGELEAIRAALPEGAPIITTTGPDGIALRFRPNEGMTPEIMALAALRGVITENVSGDGI